MTRDEILDRISEARANGYSWDDINGYFAGKRKEARDAGYSEDEINEFLGVVPGDVDERFRGAAEQSLKDSLPEPAEDGTVTDPVEGLGPWDTFTTMFRNSTSGLIATGSFDPKAEIPLEDYDLGTRLAGHIGRLVGDVPAFVVGGIAGGVAGSPAGPPGAAVGVMGGAFALPAYVRSLYVTEFEKGAVSDPQDFAIRQAAAAWEATKGFSVGASTVAGGAGATLLAVRAGAGKVIQWGAQTAGEVAAMVTVGKAIEGEIPKVQDFLDAAILIGGLKAGYAGVRKTLMKHWAETGEWPSDVVARAQRDEAFRQTILEDSVVSREPVRPEPAKPAEPVEVVKPEPAAEVVKPEPVDAVTEAAQSVASRFGKPGEGNPPKISEATGDALYREAFNAEHPLKQVLDAVQDRRGQPVAAVENPILILRAARNSSTVAKFVIEEGQFRFSPEQGTFEVIAGKKGLKQIVEPFEKEVGPDNFWTYAQSRWAIERELQGKDTGVDPSAARTVIEAGRQKYEDAFQELVEWRNTTLEALVPHIITRETFDTILAENPSYLPANRILPEAARKSGAGGTGLHPFEGSELRVKNTQELLLKQTFARYTFATNNRGVMETYALAAELGQAREVPGTRVKIKLTERELQKLEAEVLKNPEFDPDSAAIWRALSQKGKLNDNEAIFFKDGELYRVEFDDIQLANFIKGLDYKQRGPYFKAAASWMRVVRQSITHMPDFPVRMALWDVQLRWLTNPEWRLEIGGLIEGVAKTMVGEKGAADFIGSGGAVDMFVRANRDRYIDNMLKDWQGTATRSERAWNSIKNMNPGNLLWWWSNAFHRGSQYGKFLEEVRAGKTKLEAGSKAAEAAFPRTGGGGRGAQWLDEQIIFSNAYLQSIELTLRGQFGKHVGKVIPLIKGASTTVTGVKFNPAKFTAGAIALITMPTLLQWWTYKDEPWYQALSDFEKDNSYILPPTANTPTVTLHALPIASFLYGGIPRRVAQYLYDKDPEAFTRGFGESFAWSFVPPGLGFLTTNIAAPILGKLSNFNFGTQNPIVPDYMKDGRLPPQQYTNFSSWTARQLSSLLYQVPVVKNLNMNPNEIDMFINSWAGPMASAAIRYSEEILRRSGVINEDMASRPIWQMPGFTAWTASYPTASAEPIQRFYDTITEYDRLKGSMRDALVKDDLETFRTLANENPTITAMTAFELQGANALAAGSNPRLIEYLKVLRSVTSRVDPAAARDILKTRKVIDTLRQIATTIEMAETPESRAMIERFAPTGKDGPLTADDKRMLLDRLYIGMFNAAKDGNTAFRQTLDSQQSKP